MDNNAESHPCQVSYNAGAAYAVCPTLREALRAAREDGINVQDREAFADGYYDNRPDWVQD